MGIINFHDFMISIVILVFSIDFIDSEDSRSHDPKIWASPDVRMPGCEDLGI